MVRITGEGKLYLHILVLNFLLMAGVILKNFNISDYTASPHLSADQYNLILALVVVGAVFFMWTVMRGRAQKVKGLRTLSTFGFLLILVGILAMVVMLFYDDLTGSGDGNVGYRAQIIMLMGTMFGVGGTLIYTVINFPDNRQERLFKQAVHEEIQKFIKASKEEGRRRKASRRLPPRRPKAPSNLVEVEPLPEGDSSGDAEVITCDSCGKQLKVVKGRRPVAVKCTHCDSIQVVG